MAKKKPEFFALPLSTEFGMVNPGDTVMYVSTGYSHNVSCGKAEYVGYTKNGENPPRARIKKNGTRRVYKDETGKELNWNEAFFRQPDAHYYSPWARKPNVSETTEEYFYHTSLQLNRLATIKE